MKFIAKCRVYALSYTFGALYKSFVWGNLGTLKCNSFHSSFASAIYSGSWFESGSWVNND